MTDHHEAQQLVARLRPISDALPETYEERLDDPEMTAGGSQDGRSERWRSRTRC